MILKQFFSAISYIFHPLLMPLLGIYLLLMIPTLPVSLNPLDTLYLYPEMVKQYLFIVLGILTLLAPVLSLFIMKRNRIIGDYYMTDRKQRFYPYILILFYYFLAYFFVRRQLPLDYQHPALMGFLFGLFTVVLIAFVINFFTKISLHAVAIYGVCGALIGYSQTQISPVFSESPTNLYMILYLLGVAAIVIGARAYLKAHNLLELFLGALVGLGVCFVCVKFGIYL